MALEMEECSFGQNPLKQCSYILAISTTLPYICTYTVLAQGWLFDSPCPGAPGFQPLRAPHREHVRVVIAHALSVACSGNGKVRLPVNAALKVEDADTLLGRSTCPLEPLVNYYKWSSN